MSKLPVQISERELFRYIQDSEVLMLRSLLQQNYHMDILDKETGETTLTMAVHSKSYSVVQMIIDSKVNVDRKNTRGRTPISCAIDTNQPDIVELLLSSGADPNLSSTHSEGVFEVSPLLEAVHSGIQRIIEEVIDAGGKFIPAKEKYVEEFLEIVEKAFDGSSQTEVAHMLYWISEPLRRGLDLSMGGGSIFCISNSRRGDTYMLMNVLLKELYGRSNCSEVSLDDILSEGLEWRAKARFVFIDDFKPSVQQKLECIQDQLVRIVSRVESQCSLLFISSRDPHPFINKKSSHMVHHFHSNGFVHHEKIRAFIRSVRWGGGAEQIVSYLSNRKYCQLSKPYRRTNVSEALSFGKIAVNAEEQVAPFLEFIDYIFEDSPYSVQHYFLQRLAYPFHHKRKDGVCEPWIFILYNAVSRNGLGNLLNLILRDVYYEPTSANTYVGNVRNEKWAPPQRYLFSNDWSFGGLQDSEALYLSMIKKMRQTTFSPWYGVGRTDCPYLFIATKYPHFYMDRETPSTVFSYVSRSESITRKEANALLRWLREEGGVDKIRLFMKTYSVSGFSQKDKAPTS